MNGRDWKPGTEAVGKLPQVLIIDDQFGRFCLRSGFGSALNAEVHKSFISDTRNLCALYGLTSDSLDFSSNEGSAPIARASFCPAQRWSPKARRIENSTEVALESVRSGWPFDDGSRWALILLDLRFASGGLNSFGDPRESSMFGAEVLLPELLQVFGSDLPVIVLSSTPRDVNNEQVRRLGALDFIQRVPGEGQPKEEARASLQQAMYSHGLLADASGLIVGRSLSILKMLRQARRGAALARNIVLSGETGSGKGLLARYIHAVSARKASPFVVFDAAHREAQLQADHLFGHWRGAFTGADSDVPGVWEQADQGVLFIDEVSSLDVDVQQKLLQPIEERRVSRLGHTPDAARRVIEVDVLAILATNVPLVALREGGVLKEDFLNRINAFVIEVPSLRSHREDIPDLVKHLASHMFPRGQGSILGDAQEALQAHDWPNGNVRELRNVLERAMTNNPGQDITAADLGLQARQMPRIDELVDQRIQDRALVSFAELLLIDPGSLSRIELEARLAQYPGTFLDLVARCLDWSLAATQQGGNQNPTAAVRFLLGRSDVRTSEARQFLKRLLMLDRRGGGIWRRFEEGQNARGHSLVTGLMRDCRKAASERSSNKGKRAQ